MTAALQQEMSVVLVIKIPSPLTPFGLLKNYLFFIFIYCASEYVPSVMSLEVRTGFGFQNELQVFGTQPHGCWDPGSDPSKIRMCSFFF